MNHDEYTSDGRVGECKSLSDACTHFVYRHNAFRIAGLFVDASIREVKRRIDDLKHAEEMGDAEKEHCHAFALKPPPKLEQIREAALKLQDPERRIVDEFFWFWPMQWGKGKHDEALLALANGDRKVPHRIWANGLSENDVEKAVICKHNLAILYQLIALEGELLSLEKNLAEKTLDKIEEYWRKSFEWWEQLTDDETFWTLVTNRIRSLDDPRLTTGFARRMRTTFPEAMDKINASLAVQFIQKGKLELAQKHIAYMKETHQGLDDVSKTLASIIMPIQTRIYDIIKKATEIAKSEPERGAQAALDLFKTVSSPLDTVRKILPRDDHNRIDLCDAVAEAGLTCQRAYTRETRDWEQGTAILREAKRFAESDEVLELIAEHLALSQGASLIDPISEACEQAFSAAKDRPEDGLSVAKSLLSSTRPMLASLQESRAPGEQKNRGRDEVAGTVMQCVVIFGNETERWEDCVNLLEACQQIAASMDLKEYISQNLSTVRRNAEVFGKLKPISSAPSLSTISGIGFALYGATNRDEETGTYLSTYYFVFFMIPIFPICRYLVIPTLRGYRFLAKAPLRTFDKCHLCISLGLIVLLFFSLLAVGSSVTTSRLGVYQTSPTPATSAIPERYGMPSSSSQKVSSPFRSFDKPSSRRALADEETTLLETIPVTEEETVLLETIPVSEEVRRGEQRLKAMEKELVEMDRQLEELEHRMASYIASGMIDEYNELVPSFNSLVNERNDLYRDYKRLITELNNKVDLYNSGNN